uniref:PHD finger protein 3 n=1 Tax=Noccaea caerulescens TaxID=107243 RepID=A0A1J3KAK8_NOCCA
MSNNLFPQLCVNVSTPEMISNPEVRLFSQPIYNYQEAPAMQVGNQISVGHDHNVMMQPSFVRSGATVGSGSMSVNMDTTQLLGKRKSPVQPMFAGTASPQLLSVQNKRMLPMVNKGPMPVQSSSVSPRTQYLPASFVKNTSVSCSKPGKQTAARIKTSQKPLLSKHQNESSESVRSKMRESLAGALAMVQCLTEASKESKKLQSETATTPLEGHVGEPVSAASDVMVSNGSTGMLILGDLSPVGDGSVQTRLPEISTINETSDGKEIIAEGPQAVKPFPQDNVSYSDNLFSKDDLLRGNDLSWALESDIEFTENCGNGMIGAMSNDGSQEKLLLDPQVLASKIEAELFKLLGGVNKKYKEKGRSLLFNLKDKNNPKLREKVMYGEILAERLCSMSAEELASKELAEWRQAKAEEMAQMVVLQDTEVDIRSLVRKTHKGEFQVEVEPMDSGSVDISVGMSSRNWSRPKNTKKKTASITKTLGIKNELNGSNECTDTGNGVTVDDEMQAATGSLPPIVSLDEFMACIDSESPSDSLSSETGKSNDAEAVLTLTPPKESVNIGLGASSIKADLSPVKVEASPVKAGDSDLVSSKPYSDSKSELTSVSIPGGERVWEGALQFSVSSASSVIGILKSGEKTTTKEWPMLLDIKGRVRLDAFEKFVRELPNSRSRAVMVLCFVCREECSKTERENISEVVDSYAKDERVGFAEPASGVELYLCPARGRTVEILNKIVPRNQLEILKSLDDDGLIGVVVWRRPQYKKPSLASSNSHKNHHEKGSPLTTINTSSYRNVLPQVINHHDDGADVPPGFGPMAMARNGDDDDDDLPEFNYFSRGDVVMNRARRSDSVRELIHKYGKSEPLWNHQGFNDDENDVLPEWQQPQPNPNLGVNYVNGCSMVRPRSEWRPHGQGGGF